MEKTLCDLVVSIKVYSFINETMEVVYKRDTLENIDALTFYSRDVKQFFDNHKKELYQSARSVFERKHASAITDIALGSNGIYVVKDGKKIRPLFKMIDYLNKQYALKDVVLKQLYKRNIVVLYECDQYREMVGDYDSFFVGLEEPFLERIENGSYNEEDVLFFWDWIRSSTRFYPLLRFLLGNYDYELSEYDYKQFFKAIPPKEKEIEKEEQKEYGYWLPYKDD